MGEEDISSCAQRQNHVFLDVGKYPIPPDVNLESVTTSIRTALNQMGLYSCEWITAYGDGMSHSEDDLRNSSILHKPQGEMAVDLLYRANPRSPQISRPDPKSELHRVLKCLQSRDHNILLVNPEAHGGPFLFDSGQSIVDCTQDLDGGKPITLGTRMGDTTPVIEDLSSLASLFVGPERKAFVFWDVVKYPKPTEVSVLPVGIGIRAALQRLGHHGCVEILAFGADQLKRDHSQRDLYKEARIIRIRHGLYAKALDHFAELLNPGPLMVIPTPDPESDKHLHWLLNSFSEGRHCDVLRVKPPVDQDTPQDALFLYCPALILGCTDGFYEGKQIKRGRRKMKDIHVIQDFSKPITFENRFAPGVFVFWNLEDFPFPTTGWTPDTIYKKIASAFPGAGYELSVWAYVNDEEGSWGGDFLRKKTWESSIYFLPGGGDKSAIRNRMLHDIFLWKTDLEPTPANLVIVSNLDEVVRDKEFSSIIFLLEEMHYKVFVAHSSSFEF